MMTCPKIFLVLSLLTFSSVTAIDFSVIDNTGDSAGGRRYREVIGGANYATESLKSATNFIYGLFQQTNNPSDKKNVPKITLIMENGNGVAYNSQNQIHFNAGYLASYSGDVKREFTGVVYHEVTHSLQWNGAGRGPGGLIEGIADYVRLRAGYIPSHWVKPGGGNRWDQGYDVTARFLEYCNGLRNGFVAELNKKMRNDYNDRFFVELLGKDVNQLWRDYKAKYGQGNMYF